MSKIKITIINWNKYTKRYDYKRPVWFALSNDFLTSFEALEMSNEEKICWIAVLSHSSKKRLQTFETEINQFSLYWRLNEESLKTFLFKAVANGWIHCENLEPVRNPAESVQNPANSCQQIRLEEIRREEKRIEKTYSSTSLPPDSDESDFTAFNLLELWNQESPKELARVTKLSQSRLKKARARLRENPTKEYWTNVIREIGKSDFLCGNNSSAWRCTFDFVIKPDSASKILEGVYRSPGRKTKDEDWDYIFNGKKATEANEPTDVQK